MERKVGLCVASVMHGDMTLQVRAETALCGFLCIDIFKLLASERCRKLKLPTGSLFMASQTAANIQACALSALMICLSKAPEFNPWAAGHGRLTELPIEQYFGALRQTSPNAQLNCRQYFAASIKQSLKSGVKLQKVKPSIINQQPLTVQEFLHQPIGSILNYFDMFLWKSFFVEICLGQVFFVENGSQTFCTLSFFNSALARFGDCCSRALLASVRLASKVSSFSEEEIEKKYREDGIKQTLVQSRHRMGFIITNMHDR